MDHRPADGAGSAFVHEPAEALGVVEEVLFLVDVDRLKYCHQAGLSSRRCQGNRSHRSWRPRPSAVSRDTDRGERPVELVGGGLFLLDALGSRAVAPTGPSRPRGRGASAPNMPAYSPRRSSSQSRSFDVDRQSVLL